MQSYQAALRALLLHRGDALALARQAVAEAPDDLRARQLEASLLLCSRHVDDFKAVRLLAAGLHGNDGHSAAIRTAAAGDYAGASRVYDEMLGRDPRDLLALAVAQVFDYYLGDPQALLRRSSRVLRHWSAALPDYHAVLAMHAFALEECGDYRSGEEAARRALELEPLDLRAHHAVAHVLEMQGRAAEGVRWMGARSAWWTQAGAASTHLWWHLALYHLALDRADLALAIYDRRVPLGGLSERIDASALLWRLHLDGYDVAGRFDDLAEAWRPHAEDAHCAFNDLHAMMAFVGARRWDLARALLAAQAARVARQEGANYDMTRLVGMPACRAVLAYGRGQFAEAERLLRGLPPVAHRIGGSHAQRDVLHLTRAAALRCAPRSAGGWRRARESAIGFA
jgi:tetratricopeptide (TPR) repeat protein